MICKKEMIYQKYIQLKNHKWLYHLVSLLIYLFLGFIYFGLPVIHNFSNKYIGEGADPTQYMWSLKWIIYAITHGLNPFYTKMIWAPEGYDLSFNTFTPGISLISIPFTIMLGIVRTYNIWQIINPALASYFTFVLCYHITKKYTYSIVGGYIFGFSSFEIGQTLGHLHVSTIFLIPLMVHLFLLLSNNNIKKLYFVIIMTLSLVMQFLISLEMFATFTLFGFLILIVSYIYAPKQTKMSLYKASIYLIYSYIVCFIVVSPYLYFALQNVPSGVVHDPYYYANDLLNNIIPTPITIFGNYFTSITSKFIGRCEADSYFGIGLLTILLFFIKNNWRTFNGKVLIWAFMIPTVASLGPMVHIAGKSIFPSIFLPLAHIPLIKNAQPNRMVVFSFLTMSIIVTLWLANSKFSWGKFCLLLFSLFLIFPSLPYTSSDTKIPPFISASMYEKYIPQSSNLLIIPYGDHGTTMLWQAESNFYFRMAGGYLGSTPTYFKSLKVINSFFTGNPIPSQDAAIKSFIFTNDIRAVLVDSNLPDNYLKILSGLGVSPKLIGGIWIYQISDELIKEYQSNTLSNEDIYYRIPFDKIFTGVKESLQHNIELSNLYPEYLEKYGYISSSFGYGPGTANNWTKTGEWIGMYGGKIGIGIVGDSNEIKPIINKYKKLATQIYYPYPKIYNPDLNGKGQLLILFEPDAILKGSLDETDISLNQL